MATSEDATTSVNGVPCADSPRTSLTATDLHGMMLAGYTWLKVNHEVVNALNVFPVPDGDTGTNMVLTLQDACNYMEQWANGTADSLMNAVARGALMGARGNSGVILSQVLRGMAQVIGSKTVVDAATLVAALQVGYEMAYKGVRDPVEGTILTVMRAIAQTAHHAAQHTNDICAILSQSLRAAARAVDDTPKQLPILAQAGVVDSGGKGLYYILEGWLQHLRGAVLPKTGQVAAGSFAGKAEAVAGTYNYDVQFLLHGKGLQVEEIREAIGRLGDSVMVVGDEQTVKVHVHTDRPGEPLNYAVQLGTLTHIIVENMHQQYLAFVYGQRETAGPVPAPLPTAPAATMGMVDAVAYTPIGVVAVAAGRGLQNVLYSLGAAVVVNGGQTMNPSAEELLQAINSAHCGEVILLPNNANVAMAAEQAKALSVKPVHIVPTRTIPQGIAALLAFNPNRSFEANAEAMTQAMNQVRTGEVTVAVRETRFGDMAVQPGDYIGLLDDALYTKGRTAEEVALSLLEAMEADTKSIITVYWGSSVQGEQAQALARQIQQTYPDSEVEVIAGEQPHYPYIISVE